MMIDGNRVVRVSKKEARALLEWLAKPYNADTYKIVFPLQKVELQFPALKKFVLK